jgi:hypothetical protein
VQYSINLSDDKNRIDPIFVCHAARHPANMSDCVNTPEPVAFWDAQPIVPELLLWYSLILASELWTKSRDKKNLLSPICKLDGTDYSTTHTGHKEKKLYVGSVL